MRIAWRSLFVLKKCKEFFDLKTAFRLLKTEIEALF